MTFPLLRILGHRIATFSGWDGLTKQTYWTLATTGFFGSFRLGELLAPRESDFSRTSGFTWEDIRDSSESSVLIRIKQPKSGEKEGEYVDLFPFPGYDCCPVLAIRALRRKQISAGMTESNLPPFRLSSGKFVTTRSFNAVLATLLPDFCLDGVNRISCHSFRPGIPSTLSLFPELADEDAIKGWGRWSSDCYLKYTRLKLPQKASIFSRISTALQSVSDLPPTF